MADPLGNVMGRRRMVLAGLLSVAILALLAWQTQVSFGKISQQLAQMDWGLVAWALAFSTLWHLFVGADKWWRILKAQGAEVTYWEVFRVRLGSDPIRAATPFKVGEVVNAAYFGRIESSSFSRAAGSIAFDKALNAFGTIFWLYVGIAAMARVPTAGHLALYTAVGVAVLVLIGVRPFRRWATALAGTLHPKLGRFAAGVLSAFEEFPPIKKIGFLLYGIVFQVRELAVCYLLFAACSSVQTPSLGELAAYGSIVVLISNVPVPTMASIGPREAALCNLFQSFGDPAGLYLIGLMMSFSIQILPAILGIPLMFPLLRAVTRRPTATREDKAVASADPG